MTELVSGDVVVVGSGPAGATLAYELGKAGAVVHLLDKAVFPRYKICAGGLNAKTVALLPFSIEPVVERIVHRMTFTCRFSDPFTHTSPKPLVYMVCRDKFDDFLAQRAIEAGAQFHPGEKAVVVRMDSQHAEVETPAHVYRASIVVGADGANGIVRRQLGLAPHLKLSLGLESEIGLLPHVNASPDTLHVDWGSNGDGYAWIFPKQDHLSIGAKGAFAAGGDLLKYYRAFVGRREEIGELEEQRCVGHPLPMRLGQEPIQRQRALVVGDAAGLIDAFSGEGIYYAIRSGQLAAASILQAMQQGVVDLTSYETAVNQQIMPELRAAYYLLHIFRLSPMFFHKLIRDHPHAWTTLCDILRGEVTFAGVRRKLGSIFLRSPFFSWKAHLS
jgi:geranylgeranyl reductase family protein